MILLPGFVIIPIKSPIMPAKSNILVNVNIILDAVTLTNLLESICITLHVTDENMIGIIDIDNSVKNILLSVVKDLPTSGKYIAIKIAHTAPTTVEYPLLSIFDIFPINTMLSP